MAADPSQSKTEVVAPHRVGQAAAIQTQGRRFRAFPDVAKVAAIFAVVTVHTCAGPNEQLGILTDATWTATTAVETFTRWCVPIFIMVSGMLLLQSRTAAQSPRSFYARRASRIVIPLVGWTIFYRAFIEHTGPHANFEETVQAIYSGQPYYHLYFLFVIAGLYMICPYLARGIDGLSQRQLAALTVTTLIVCFLWTGVSPWLPPTGSNAFSIFAPYVGYFLAGCWLGRVRLDRQLVLGAVMIFCLVGVASTLATYEFAHISTPLDWRYLYGYTTPTVMVMSLAVFVALRWACERREEAVPIKHMVALHYVGEATFGIFLIHPFFLTLWLEHYPQPIEALHLLWWLPATVIGLIAVSFICTILMKQIPGLRRLV
jgi:surface polysaccharide O-acyltransferase-like enzyme